MSFWGVYVMATSLTAQQYVVFDAEALVRPASLAQQPLQADVVQQALLRELGPHWAGVTKNDFTVEDVPLVTFYSRVPGLLKTPFTPQEVCNVSFPTDDRARNFRDAVIARINKGDSPLRWVGINPALTVGEYSIPVAPDATLFGTLDDARRLIGADQLQDLNGQSVNVVLIDSGIDESIIPAGHFGGGWQPTASDPTLPAPPLPGMTTGTDALHGMMIVNNILAMAPRVTIFDVPLIPPPKIYNIPNFLHAAHAVFHKILKDIQAFRQVGLYPGPWIFMNAWAIFDRRSEGMYLGEYTENLGTPGLPPPHYFIRMIEQVASHKFDMVFCAGNCGEVCPDGRCGPDDYGPGRGIWGANAHRDVLTVGGVRVDETWPGYSSEGPGPTPHLQAQKPDLCAPTQFVGASGLYPPSTGTSASAAVAAGIVCALRSKATWDQTTIPPVVLKLILNYTAMQTQGPGWNRRLGNGVLDAFAAYQQLVSSYP
jgi:hypothetical protein